MPTTLRDVAELARVSVKTVSNVIHGFPHVSDDLRGRVETAVRELDYRPNLAARALRTGRSGLIALAVPSVDAPCPPGLIDQVIGRATRLGFQVVIEPIGSPGRPHRVDAVLLSGGTPAAAHARAGVPLIVLGGDLDNRFDGVALDATRAARDATEHLLRTGRRRIAAIGADAGPRTTGYRQAMSRAGLRLPPRYLRRTAGQRHADGYRAATPLLAGLDRPDAIFCHDDRLAGGVLRAAADVGVRVPDELAVIGMGDRDEGRYSRPTLSTVSADAAFIARTALDLLARRLEDPAAAPKHVVAPHVVTPRESTAQRGGSPGSG